MTTLDLVNGLEGAETGGVMYIMKSYVDTVYTVDITGRMEECNEHGMT
jgi:hypothetical protein